MHLHFHICIYIYIYKQINIPIGTATISSKHICTIGSNDNACNHFLSLSLEFETFPNPRNLIHNNNDDDDNNNDFYFKQN
jgi:hypothetical protein